MKSDTILITNLCSVIIQVPGAIMTASPHALVLFQRPYQGEPLTRGENCIRGFGTEKAEWIFDRTLACGYGDYQIFDPQGDDSHYKWITLAFADGTTVKLQRMQDDQDLVILRHENYEHATRNVLPRLVRKFWHQSGNFPVRNWLRFADLPPLTPPIESAD
ncbi:MAG: hypothetical protein V4467_00685 [Patescibacteria group bacterium]